MKQPCAPCFWGEPDANCNCPDGVMQTGGIKPIPGVRPLDNRTNWNLTPPLMRPLAVMGINGANPLCEGLPHTPGYRWIWDGQKCSQVVNYEYNPNVGQKQTTANSNFLSNLLSGGSSMGGGFIENNKGLLLLGAAAVAFMMFSGGSMKPKSRESIVTTKY